jgi:hypothetical protein
VGVGRPDYDRSMVLDEGVVVTQFGAIAPEVDALAMNSMYIAISFTTYRKEVSQSSVVDAELLCPAVLYEECRVVVCSLAAQKPLERSE